MLTAWPTITWGVKAVVAVYVVVQVVAISRLRGQRRKRSMQVVPVILVAEGVSVWVRWVGNIEAARAAVIGVGLLAVGAVIVLIRMLVDQSHVEEVIGAKRE